MTEAEETAAGAAQAEATGPWDVAEPHPELPRVDLGSLQVPVLEGTDIQLVFAEQHGAWVTVRHELSELQLQAFAAPKRSGLWDEVRGEIAAEIGGAGGQAAEREGPFGTELHRAASPPSRASRRRACARSGSSAWTARAGSCAACSPARRRTNPAAAAPLEAVMREVVVVRGEHPMPPRDLLELRLPAEAAAALEEQARSAAAGAGGAASQPCQPFDRSPEIPVRARPGDRPRPASRGRGGPSRHSAGEEALQLLLDVLRW